MQDITEHVTTRHVQQGQQFLTTYSLNKGIKKFGERGRQSALSEMKQLHDRDCFTPIDVTTLTTTERKRAMESLIFLVEKKSGKVKARHCANGSVQRGWMSREDTSSPTVSTEAIFLTSVIEAEEERDVATCDIPNAFIQTECAFRDKDGHRTVMKIRGVLVDILCDIDPKYRMYVVYERGQPVLYVHVIKAIYGMLLSALLYYNKFKADIEEFGFTLNPYDPQSMESR